MQIPTDRSTTHRRFGATRRRLTLGPLVAVLTLLAAPSTTAADSVGAWDTIVRTVDDPESTTPTTAVDTTAVETTVPEEEPPTPEDGDADSADALTWLAVGGSLLLMAVAAWWMARRGPGTGGDRPMDDDWPRRTEVV